MINKIFRSKRIVLLFIILLLESTNAHAIPTLFDQWLFFCQNSKANDANIAAAEKLANQEGNNTEVGINMQKLACLLYAKEKQLHELRLQKFYDSGAKGNPPVANFGAATEYIKSANIRLAEGLKSKSKENLEKTLYYYGLGLALMKNPLAVNMFDKLMTDYPKSTYAKMAYISLGDYYLDKPDVASAKREYTRVIPQKGEPVASQYAKYKMAWVNFAIALNEKKVNEQRNAMQQFANLIQELNKGKGKQKKLAGIVSKDLIEILVALGNPNDVKQIFSRINQPDKIAKTLSLIAANQAADGNIKGAYATLEPIVKQAQPSMEILESHIQLTQLAAQLDNVLFLVKNLKELANNYGEKSPWAQNEKTPEAKKKIAWQKIENLMYQYAITLDEQGSNANKPHYLAGALQLYPLFLKTFPKSKQTYNVKYFHAKLLFQRKKFLPAAVGLKEIIVKNPKGKYTADAANVMVTAAQSLIDAESKQYTIPPLGTVKRKITLPRSKKLYIDCLDVYIKHMPKNENTLAMHFAIGSALYEFGHYIEAQKKYVQVINAAPKDQFALTASYQLLLAFKNLNDIQRFTETRDLIAKYDNIKSNPEIAPFFQVKVQSKDAPKNVAQENTASSEDNAIAEESTPDETSTPSGENEGEVVPASVPADTPVATPAGKK